MNVIGARPTGWWRDRDGAVRALVDRLRALAAADAHGITVIVDGRPISGLPEGDHEGVEVLYAARSGRNAADDRIVEFLRAQSDPRAFEVITSDRDLTGRATALGAGVHGALSLLERLDRFDA